MPELVSIFEKDIRPSVSGTSALGRRGEVLAAEYLAANGYRIIMTNFTAPIGRTLRGARVTGEIDIIALEADTLCFVEVKARSSEAFVEAITAVNLRKQRQIARTARVYRRLFDVWEMPIRFDVITIVDSSSGPAIELHRGFWNESVFRKRSWQRDA